MEQWFPPATGGGCIESGPFTADKYNVSLGPYAFEPRGPQEGRGYNPRCLTRDLSLEWAKYHKPSLVLEALNWSSDLAEWDEFFEFAPINIHAIGHYTIGGIEHCTYSSPGDPAFFVHHAQVDRIWTIWQGQDPKNRVNQTALTETAGNCKFTDMMAEDERAIANFLQSLPALMSHSRLSRMLAFSALTRRLASLSAPLMDLSATFMSKICGRSWYKISIVYNICHILVVQKCSVPAMTIWNFRVSSVRVAKWDRKKGTHKAHIPLIKENRTSPQAISCRMLAVRSVAQSNYNVHERLLWFYPPGEVG